MKNKITVPKCFCPPHRFPHKLPIGKMITNEPCHIHESKIEMIHHSSYCKITRCPNYKKMIKFYKDHEKTN